MARRKPRSRRRRKQRFNIGRLLSRLLIIGIIGAVGWWVFGLAGDAVMAAVAGTATARPGTVEQLVKADCWLIPTIVQTEPVPLTGVIYFKAQDGERARVGTCVAELVDPTAQSELVGRLTTLDDQLAQLKQRNAAEREQVQTRLKEIDAQLATKLADLRTATQQNDKTLVDRLQSEVRALGVEKDQLAGKLTTLDQSEAQAGAERQTAADAISRAAVQLTAIKPGVVAYNFDGLEDALTAESAITMGSRGLWSLQAKPAILKDKQTAQAGQSAFKIIDPTQTCLALAVKADDHATLGSGVVTLRFPELGGATVSAEPVTVGKVERNGYQVVIYRTAEFLPAFGQQRQLKVEIVKSAGSGLVIPRRAVVARKGQNGVWEVRRGAAQFVPVTILCGNEEQVAVSGLTDGAEVVRNGRFVLRAGQRIR